MAETSSSPIAANSSNVASARAKEEIEAARSKLTDQNFFMGRYADPLLSRPPSNPQLWPRGLTQEMEKRWLAMIKEYRSA